MSDTDWHAVWSRRDAAGGGDALQRLIDLDGFDTGAGRIAAADWRAYAAAIAQQAGIVPGSTVYEIGCGAGAFLYALQELGATVSGSDYAANLVQHAREALPGADLQHAEAIAMPTAPSCDVVLANSVFHYFPDLGYAQAVLRRMLAKARQSVAVLEVPDLTRRDAAEAARRAHLSEAEYEARYRGLPHRYYERAWFERIAIGAGWTARCSDQCIAHYAQSAFRFNCILTPPP